jgi:hypothetical protein
MKQILRISLFFLLVGILTISNPVTATNNTPNIIVPEFIQQSQYYQATPGEPLVLIDQGSPSVVGSRLINYEPSTSQIFRDVVVPGGTPRAVGENIALGAPGTYVFTNTTSEPAHVQYRALYYDLFSNNTVVVGNNTQLRQEVFLTGVNQYGFQIELNSSNPAYFFSRFSQSTAATATITMIDPDGNEFARTYTIIRNVNQYIPILANMDGVYTIFLTISAGHALLTNFGINDNPTIHDVTGNTFSHQDRYTGEETIIEFFKIPAQEVPHIYQIDRITYVSFNLAGLPYLGTFTARLFNTETNTPTGVFLSANNNIRAVGDVYIAIIATPPDETDPSIKGEKQANNLAAGMDIENTLIVQSQPLPELPLNTYFTTSRTSQHEGFTKTYYFSTTTTRLFGINTTGGGAATIWLQGTPQPGANLNPNNNDVLNFVGDNLVVVQPGDYYVQFPMHADYQITDFSYSQFPTVGENDITLSTITDRNFFELAPTASNQAYLNMTYSNEINQSHTIRLDMYSGTGGFVGSMNLNFDHYYDNATADYIVNNQTVFTDPIAVYDAEYYSFTLVNSNQYNTTGHIIPEIEPSVTFQVQRYDNYVILAQNNPNDVYETRSTLDGFDIIAGNQIVFAYYQFNVNPNGAYRFIFNSQNRTLITFTLLGIAEDGTQLNIPTGAITATNIANITHHSSETIFGSLGSLRIYAFLSFATNNTANATFNLTLETIPSFTLPPVQLTKIQTVGEIIILPVTEPTPINPLTNPNIMGPVVAILAIGAVGGAMVYLLKKSQV